MKSKNLINYTDCYVAFLDILGFENLVRSKNREAKDKIEKYFQIINYAVNELKRIPSKRNLGTIIISDSVILTIPKSSDQFKNIETLRQLLIAIRYIQFNLALSNIWLRGGVSSGDAYFNSIENQIIGPAYIDAYKLESTVAIFPRVVIDSKIISEFACDSASSLIDEINNKHAKSSDHHIEDRNVVFQWEESEYETVGMKKDVALFVDYLAPSFTEKERLIKVVDNIADNLYQDNHVYSKFRWVVEYMMSWCMPKGRIHRYLERGVVSEQFDRLRGL